MNRLVLSNASQVYATTIEKITNGGHATSCNAAHNEYEMEVRQPLVSRFTDFLDTKGLRMHLKALRTKMLIR